MFDVPKLASLLMLAVVLTACSSGSSSLVPKNPSVFAKADANHVVTSSGRVLTKLSFPAIPGLIRGTPPPPNLVPMVATAKIPGDTAMTARALRFRPHGFPDLSQAQANASASASSRSPKNFVYQQDGGGQFGYVMTSSRYNAILSGLSGYENGEIWPNYDGDVLYAPTTRAPSGSCLEAGTSYWQFSQPTAYVWDFCDHGGPYGVIHPISTIDQNFRNSWERDYGDGVPQYTVQISLVGNGYWTASYYNYALGQWQARYTSASTSLVSNLANAYNATWGWDLFETHYTGGTYCPTLGRRAEAGGIQVFDTYFNNWMYIDGIDGLSKQNTGSCMNYDDGSGGGYYYTPNYFTQHSWYAEIWASGPATGP